MRRVLMQQETRADSTDDYNQAGSARHDPKPLFYDGYL